MLRHKDAVYKFTHETETGTEQENPLKIN
jgi:hypothetical protein